MCPTLTPQPCPDPLAEYVSFVFRDGLAPGIDGYWDDTVAFLAPWSFELDDITLPMLLVHGRQDRSVPFSHGGWHAEDQGLESP